MNGGTLISLTTAKIVKIENTTVSGIGSSGLPTTYAQTVYTVSDSSITDITNDINKNGNIYVSFDRVDSTAIEYVLYAAYYVLSGDKNCVAGPDPQTFLQNGSFIVDHFSKTGAKVTTDFLEKYVLVNGVKELMTSIGGYCKILVQAAKFYNILIPFQYGRTVWRSTVLDSGRQVCQQTSPISTVIVLENMLFSLRQTVACSLWLIIRLRILLTQQIMVKVM
jgi:hypothetical protein